MCSGQSYWGHEMHEPLMIGLCFPFINCEPWQLRSTPVMLGLSRMLRGRWKDRDKNVHKILKQVFMQVGRLKIRAAGEIAKLVTGSVGEFLSYRKGRKRKVSEV